MVLITHNHPNVHQKTYSKISILFLSFLCTFWSLSKFWTSRVNPVWFFQVQTQILCIFQLRLSDSDITKIFNCAHISRPAMTALRNKKRVHIKEEEYYSRQNCFTPILFLANYFIFTPFLKIGIKNILA